METFDTVNEQIRLLQRADSLRFGTDAFLLSAFCRPDKRAEAVELGCGTGIISLLLAARQAYRHVTAVEIQPDMHDVACRNIAENGFSDTVSALLGDLRELSATSLGREVEVVLANPPYMRVDSGLASPSAAKQISRHEVSGGIAEFTAAAARCLKFGGVFYTVYRPDRLESLFAALRAHRFAPKRMVFVHDHPKKEPSMVLTEARLGAGEGLTLLPPLFLHDLAENGTPFRHLSPKAQEIYDTGRLE
ncbi:MAG: methyltransferase [Clostridia bacterium]|nr:methyltransferase [Clostridia bacterium]